MPVGPFFLILSLVVAIASFVLLRGQSAAALSLIAFTLVGAGLAGTAVYRMLAPLVVDLEIGTPLIDGRTRAALERDKQLVLRSLKELEFDRAMGKISGPDFEQMRDRLRARALRLIRQLDDAQSYRAQIERDLDALLQAAPAGQGAAQAVCRSCGAPADSDARFCKMCGQALA
ncbi:MAG TPA: zinc ribbon domain-containing protein [Vicinamibacterales bacterium]